MNRAPPCTTRWPTDGGCASSVGPSSANDVEHHAQPAVWSAIGSSRDSASADAAVDDVPRGPASPMRSTSPTSSTARLDSITSYLIEDDPELRTRTVERHAVTQPCAWIAVIATVLTMSRTSAPRERSLTGLRRPCSTGPIATAPGAALHRLVGVVAGVEVGEDEHRRAAGDLRLGQLRCGDGGIGRGVVLDRPLDEQVGRALAHERGRRAHLVDVGARARLARRVGEHRHPRLDAELRGGAPPTRSRCRRAARGRVGDDGAVAVDEHAVGEAMRNTLETTATPGRVLMISKRRADRVRGRVRRARHHAVGEAEVHHHRAEVGDVGHDVARLLDRDALVRAQLARTPRRTARAARDRGLRTVGGRDVDAEPGGARADLALVAEQREVGDRRAEQRVGRLQDAVVVALGQHDVLALASAPARAASYSNISGVTAVDSPAPSSREQRVRRRRAARTARAPCRSCAASRR